MTSLAKESNNAAAALRGVNIERTFRTRGDEVTAVAGVSLEVRPGELLAIMGPSGSGKSTLLSILGGLDRPTRGEVWLGDRPLHRATEHELSLLRRRHIGFVFQSFHLIPTATLADNVALPLLLGDALDEEAYRRVADALASVGLAARADHLPDEVSVGERQRAAIARALVSQPELVLADEPTASLDRKRGQEIIELLRGAAHAGRAVVVVTHDAEVARNADRVIAMRDGRVVDVP